MCGPECASGSSLLLLFAPAVIFARPESAPRIALPEGLERARFDRPAEVARQPLVEPNIMHGRQHRAKHLARQKIVTDRPEGKFPAGVTVAARLDRAGIFDVFAVAKADRAVSRKS